MNSNIKTGSPALLGVSSAGVLACVFGASNAFADDQIRVETVKFQAVSVRSPSASRRSANHGNDWVQATVAAP